MVERVVVGGMVKCEVKGLVKGGVNSGVKG